MPVIRHRLEVEQLRIHSAFNSSTTRTTPGLEARNANGLYVRIVWLQPLSQLRELTARIDIVEIEHQALRVFHRQHLVRDRGW